MTHDESRPRRSRQFALTALLGSAFALGACDVQEMGGGNDSPPLSTVQFAVSTEADGTAEGPAVTSEVPPGVYSFDEMAALLVAADPGFAEALASAGAAEPPQEGVPAAFEPAERGPCTPSAVPPTHEVSEGTKTPPYAPPSWEHEVTIDERLAVLPMDDRVPLESMRATLAALATEGAPTEDGRTDAP